MSSIFKSLNLFTTIAILFLYCSCVPTPDKQSNLEAIVKAAEDSIIHLNQIREQEAIQREQIFAALGDTAFKGVCFGMTEKQYTKAFQAFKKPLKKEGTFCDFELAGYEFRGDDVSHVEKNKDISIYGWPYGLERIH